MSSVILCPKALVPTKNSVGEALSIEVLVILLANLSTTFFALPCTEIHIPTIQNGSGHTHNSRIVLVFFCGKYRNIAIGVNPWIRIGISEKPITFHFFERIRCGIKLSGGSHTVIYAFRSRIYPDPTIVGAIGFTEDLIMQCKVEKAFFFPQFKTIVQSCHIVRAIAFYGWTDLGSESTLIPCFSQFDIDNTRNRIRAILRGSIVSQYLSALCCKERNCVHIRYHYTP